MRIWWIVFILITFPWVGHRIEYPADQFPRPGICRVPPWSPGHAGPEC